MADDNFPIGVPIEHTERPTTPTTPAAGFILFYPKTDHSFYRLDSTGTETQIGGGDEAYAFFMS